MHVEWVRCASTPTTSLASFLAQELDKYGSVEQQEKVRFKIVTVSHEHTRIEGHQGDRRVVGIDTQWLRTFCLADTEAGGGQADADDDDDFSNLPSTMTAMCTPSKHRTVPLDVKEKESLVYFDDDDAEHIQHELEDDGEDVDDGDMEGFEMDVEEQQPPIPDAWPLLELVETNGSSHSHIPF